MYEVYKLYNLLVINTNLIYVQLICKGKDIELDFWSLL